MDVSEKMKIIHLVLAPGPAPARTFASVKAPVTNSVVSHVSKRPSAITTT